MTPAYRVMTTLPGFGSLAILAPCSADDIAEAINDAIRGDGWTSTEVEVDLDMGSVDIFQRGYLLAAGSITGTGVAR